MNDWKRNRDVFDSCFYGYGKECNIKNIIIDEYYRECENCKEYVDEVALDYQGIIIN